MKVAVIGSRGLRVADLGMYLPPETSVIISGGAVGIDGCAKEYAHAHGLELIEFLPDYARFGKSAPLVRNKLIVKAADWVLAIWDGRSRGSKYTIDYAKGLGKPVDVIIIDNSAGCREINTASGVQK